MVKAKFSLLHDARTKNDLCVRQIIHALSSCGRNGRRLIWKNTVLGAAPV
jgi:hypothetical protein